MTTIDLSADGPRDPQRTRELSETFAGIARALASVTMDRGFAQYPAEVDRVLRDISLGIMRLPQVLAHLERWPALENAAGRIEMASGEWAGRPDAAVSEFAARMDLARAAAEALHSALESAATVTSDMAAAGDE